MNNVTSLDSWANEYIQFQENYNSDLSDIYSDIQWKPIWDFQDRLLNNAELSWQSILTVLEKTNSDKVLRLLACGPLEDFIELYGDTYIEKIEDLARKNNKFKQLLEVIWQSGSPKTWNRIMQLRTTPNFFENY